MPRSCGTKPKPSRAIGVGRQPDDVAIAVADTAGPRLQISHDGEDRRGLAGAVAAEQADDLALPYRQRDAMQDVAVAVIGVDVLDLEHQCTVPR